MKELEAEVVQRNAWRVAQDFVSRIDGEPGPTGDCMKAFVTNRKEQQFFFNTEYTQQYNAAKSETRKVKVPGHNYFKKLDDFMKSCMTTGEIFHEYCENESVDPTPVQFQTSTNFQSITICLLQKHPSQIQWNSVNTDTKGTCHSVCIIRVSVLSGLSEKTSGTHVLSI